VVDELTDAWGLDYELVLARATKTMIMLVTQTCDIDRRKWLQVAPVFKANLLGEDKRESLRTNEINYLFYLPAAPPLLPDENYADFSRITSVHNSYFREARPLKRLKSRATLELQAQLAKYHGRPFGFSVRDTVPQRAEYICINCFLEAGQLQKVIMERNARFADCPGCLDSALWTKFSDA